MPDTPVSSSLAPLARRDVRIHDPSTIVRCGAWYTVFGTGPGIPFWRSRDLTKWERVSGKGQRVFEVTPKRADETPGMLARPAWWNEAVPNFDGNCWAADIIKLNNRYFLYYSVSAWGKNTSAIGLAINATLDPTDPKYAWTDAGIVIRSQRTDNYNAIDPSVCRDNRTGELWLAFGSFWSGIKVVSLDAKTGLPRTGFAPAIVPLAWNQTIEAACLLQKNDWWFLFVNWGWCCRGVKSTYEIRVGRSKRADGPFWDKEGKELTKGGGSLFLASDVSPGAFIGPGHAGFVDGKRASLLSCHFYDGDKNGAPTLGILPIAWSKNNWPEVKTPLPKHK